MRIAKRWIRGKRSGTGMRAITGGEWITSVVVIALAVLLAGCSSDDDPMCFGSDVRYAIGEVYMDGCRQCTCNADTTITCVATEACDAGCEDTDGNEVEVGSYFPAGDGCNLCQCVSAGEVECTEDPCGMM